MQPDAKVRVLKEIVLKPRAGAKRGDGDPRAQQERKHIQQGVKKPVESIMTCLEDSQREGEFADALRVLADPGATAPPLPDSARTEARADSELRAATLDYLEGDHSARVLRTLYTESEQLERAAHAIHAGAAAALFTPRETKAA